MQTVRYAGPAPVTLERSVNVAQVVGVRGLPGLPGTNGVASDAATAGYVANPASLTQPAVDARVTAASAAAGYVKLSDVMVNAGAYGVLGAADDAATIQAAADDADGRAVYIPAHPSGSAWTLGKLVLPAGTTLALAPGAILKAKNGLNDDLVTNVSGADDVAIIGGHIDGNKANQTDDTSARGIYLVNCARALVDSVHLYDVEGHAIHFSNSGATEGQRVENVVIERAGSSPTNNMGSGFAATSATDLTIVNTHVLDSAKAGFRLSGYGIQLNGCIARRNDNGGVVTVSGSMTGLVVLGGEFSDNGGGSPPGECDGIRLVGADNVTLNGPTCSGNTASGVGVYNSSTNISLPVVKYRTTARKRARRRRTRAATGSPSTARRPTSTT